MEIMIKSMKYANMTERHLLNDVEAVVVAVVDSSIVFNKSILIYVSAMLPKQQHIWIIHASFLLYQSSSCYHIKKVWFFVSVVG